MNYDQPPLEAGDEPAAGPENGTHADAYVADIVANAQTSFAAQLISKAYADHGTAFALYMALDGVSDLIDNRDGSQSVLDRAANFASLEADFTEAFYGRFPDQAAIVDDTIASFDWGSELRRLLIGHPELQNVVDFNRDAVWEFANQYYEVVDGTDGLYVFERWR